MPSNFPPRPPSKHSTRSSNHQPSNNNAFLTGINVGNLDINPLSLPDPPTPDSSNRRSRRIKNGRRRSTSEPPLRDITSDIKTTDYTSTDRGLKRSSSVSSSTLSSDCYHDKKNDDIRGKLTSIESNFESNKVKERRSRLKRRSLSILPSPREGALGEDTHMRMKGDEDTQNNKNSEYFESRKEKRLKRRSLSVIPSPTESSIAEGDSLRKKRHRDDDSDTNDEMAQIKRLDGEKAKRLKRRSLSIPVPPMNLKSPEKKSTRRYGGQGLESNEDEENIQNFCRVSHLDRKKNIDMSEKVKSIPSCFKDERNLKEVKKNRSTTETASPKKYEPTTKASKKVTSSRRKSLLLPSDTLPANELDSFLRDGDNYQSHLRYLNTKNTKPPLSRPPKPIAKETSSISKSTSYPLNYTTEKENNRHRIRSNASTGNRDACAKGSVEKSNNGRDNNQIEKAQNISKSKNDVDLIQTIRDYCALPLHQRAKSNHAKIISEVCDYKLLPQSSRRQASGDDMNWTSSPGGPSPTIPIDPRAEKLNLLHSLGPLVNLMEAKKTSDEKTVASLTGCRVEKGRGGKFRYIDIATGTRVRAEEYAVVYKTAMEKEKRRKEALRCELMKGKEAVKHSCGKNGSNDKKNIEGVDNDDMSIDTIDDRTIETEDESGSFLKDKTDTVNHPREVISSPNCRKRTEATVKILSSKSFEWTTICRASNLTDKSDVILQLPSRDKRSSDARVAAAEDKLWKVLDSALEEYSRDILAIRAYHNE